MKRILLLLLLLLLSIISLFLFSCNKDNKINENEIIIKGEICKALYVAIETFSYLNFPIERYEIQLKDDNEYFEISFDPIIIDWKTANWGAQDFGGGVVYFVSKKTFKIEKWVFSR